MISRRIFAAVALLCAITVPAYAQKTKAQLNSEIGVNFPDNTQQQILPLNLRNVGLDTVNSIMPTAPVASGNFASFNGTTGLLQDSGIFSTFVQPEAYGAKRDGSTDDTAAMNAAISAAALSHRGVLLAGGGSYCVQPITVSDASGSMPAFFSGLPASQAALRACNASSNPTLTLSSLSDNGFVAENFRVNSASLHANGVLITAFIRGRVRNISATGATGAGFKFYGVGTPTGNIEYSSFRDLLSIANGGAGFDFESDATCQPGSCVSANDFSGLSAYTNAGDGYFVDYASIHCKNCESESNGGYALNLNHTYVGNWDGFYAEANTLGGPNGTSNTYGISMIGARLGDSTGIGIISSNLTSCTTCLIDYEGLAFGSRITNFGAFTAQSANVAGGVSAGGSAIFSGDFNVATGGGYRINGGATANHPLCGNAGGTKYVDCPTIPSSAVSGLAPSATTDTTNASNISSGTLPAGRMPSPTASTLGGVESYVAVAHQWINSISTGGAPSSTQPATTDLSDVSTSTWAPTDQSGAALTFTSVNCRYTREGNMVHAYGTFTFPTTASSATVLIGGLPFAVPNQSYAAVPSPIKATNGAGAGLVAVPVINTSNFNIWTNATGANLANSALTTVTVTVNITYPAT